MDSFKIVLGCSGLALIGGLLTRLTLRLAARGEALPLKRPGPNLLLADAPLATGISAALHLGGGLLLLALGLGGIAGVAYGALRRRAARRRHEGVGREA